MERELVKWLAQNGPPTTAELKAAKSRIKQYKKLVAEFQQRLEANVQFIMGGFDAEYRNFVKGNK